MGNVHCLDKNFKSCTIPVSTDLFPIHGENTERIINVYTLKAKKKLNNKNKLSYLP